MWQKIKNNLLTIATSAYFLFWGYFIIGSHIYYKIYENNPSLAQQELSKNWNGVILESIIFTTLSFFLIFVLIRKKKAKILKLLSYFFVPLVFIVNIFSVGLFINARIYNYFMYGTNEQKKQVLSTYNPNFPNIITGGNLLHTCFVFKQDKDIIEFLINNGFKVNKVDYFGNTPLIYAVTESSPEIVELLVKNGADVNFQVKKLNNYTPLMEAIVLNNKINDKEKIVEILINVGSNVNLKSKDGRKALDYAVIVYSKNKDKITLRTIELLLEAGANTYLKPSEDFLSPYETAQKYENKELIELFDKYRPVE